MSTRFHSNPLRPLRPNDWGTGGLIAFAAHMVLLISLTLAMNWPRQNTFSASAELWSSIPMEGAPAQLETLAKPEPKPTPEPPLPTPEKKIELDHPSADIALEQQQELEKLRLEKEMNDKQEKMLREEALKDEEKEAEKRYAENLAQITGMTKVSKDSKGEGPATQSTDSSAYAKGCTPRNSGVSLSGCEMYPPKTSQSHQP